MASHSPPKTAASEATCQRTHLRLRGALQGVGFRPFVFRLATTLELNGWVRNDALGVEIEIEGPTKHIEAFLHRLRCEKPAAAHIDDWQQASRPLKHDRDFRILASASAQEAPRATILPDLAMCDACRAELDEPTNRRYRYPFINCTHCGPRLSIVRALPYDRPRTTMAGFEMCDACREEYENQCDRRFHAQPIACPACGPNLAWCDEGGRTLCGAGSALNRAVEALRAGRIVAVKGLGGFHLMVDARNEGAIARLRERKNRDAKPFAVMFPDLDTVRAHARVCSEEARLLNSSEAPIVLLRRNAPALPGNLAPGLHLLGAMLPYTPLHYLLLKETDFPCVATSGNLSDEPICIENAEAFQRLHGMADGFLVHDRPIARAVEDSVVRVVAGRPLILRRARGYAPRPQMLPDAGPAPLLAVGAHQKNTVALGVEDQAFLPPHIGDLDTTVARQAFRRCIDDFEALYERRPAEVVCDKHPEYASSQWAAASSLKLTRVQHHYAHILSCLADNRRFLHTESVLGVAWDGTGLGDDGALWGGEFLRVDTQGYERLAHLRTFPLPGGEKAVREGRRAALGILYETYGASVFNTPHPFLLRAFDDRERAPLRAMLEQNLNTPRTSSIGRLFDAVAALAGIRNASCYEGQAAMEFECAAEDGEQKVAPYVLVLKDGILDWAPMLDEVCRDVAEGVAPATIAVRFHAALVAGMLEVARWADLHSVVLSGGCFQNARLLEHAVTALRDGGFEPLWHRDVPPNDGGIALGQLVAARLRRV